MKRKEEITKKALELDTTNDIATFVVAAQWADKTMIEKIRIWVTERYDLDYRGDFKDLLDYIKSL